MQTIGKISRLISFIFVAGLLSYAAPRSLAGDFSLKTATQPPPPQVSEAVRALLAPSVIELTEGGVPAYQLWLRKDIPLKSKPSSPDAALGSLGQTTLIGVLSIQKEGFKDYKDNDIAKGVYTARFALQPQDGDHLGTAEYSYFLVLLPASVDKEENTFTKFTPMVKASGKLTPSGHPQVISLRPPGSSGGQIPCLTEPTPEHKAIRIKASGKADGQNADLIFELVYAGHGNIQ